MDFDTLFSKTYSVPEMECDESGTCTLPYVLRCMEDAAFEDAERIGQGRDCLRDKYGLCWMIYQSTLTVNAMPKAGSEFSVRTSCCGVHGATVLRVYDIFQSAEPILHCEQSWVVVSLSKRCLADPQKVPELMQTAVPKSTRCRQNFHAEIPLHPASTRCVQKSDLDFNGHMNNVRYAEHALPYLPLQALPCRLELAYRYELTEGQTYDILSGTQADIGIVVFRSDGKDCFRMQTTAGA